MKYSLQLILAAAAAVFVSACASTGESPQMTTAPSGANSTTHGSVRSGQPSGPNAGSAAMRQ